MALRVAVIGGDPEDAAALARLLRAAGAEPSLLPAPPAEPDPGVSLVLLDHALAGGAGSNLPEPVRSGHPAALVCLLVPFMRRPAESGAISAGFWDTLYLPAQQDEVEDLLRRTDAFLARRALADRRRAILVVDDEESIREVSRDLLERQGYAVETAVDALEAVGKLHLRPYDLVVTDLQMPGLDGVALLGRIRAVHPRLPVVISTGHATVDTAIAALRTGATDFIRKPFSREDYLRVVEHALRFGELARANLELELLAREEKTRLRERQYELRVLAAAIGEMSRAVHPAEVAECWLRAACRIVDFSCGAILLLHPDAQLVHFPPRPDGCRPQQLLELFARRAPELVAGLRLEELLLRPATGVVAAARGLPPSAEAAVVSLFGPEERPIAGAAMLQASGASLTPAQASFLRSLAAQAAQVLEKLRALAGESRLREAAMVAGMHQGVILADLQGRILVMNAAARELLGLPADCEARTLSHLSAERNVPLGEAVAGVLDSGARTLSREFTLSQPGERILTLDLTVIHGDLREPIAVVALLRDITELRENERMKTELVTIVSHELRTPLTTIKNCTSLLLGGGTGSITPAQERFLRMAQVSADRIIGLVNDLLDVAKIESGGIPLECAPVELGELLGEIGNEAEYLALERGLRLDLENPEPPLVIRADRHRLKQVLFNLVHNAVKFSAPGGRIELRAAEVAAADCPPAVRALLRSADGPLVEIQVADEGVGIAAADLERIFERFHQVASTLRREHGGVGLGLPISRGIVRSHGGEIWAERRAGGGSVFRVLLPRDCGECDGREPGDAA